MRPRLLHFAHLTRAAIAALLLMPALASGQDVTESALKAAFIYNFAKFIEWPADAMLPAAPFVMCVLGDEAVAEALERAVKARVLAGHVIAVSYVPPTGVQGVCHILYVSGATAAHVKRLVAAVRDTPVLTISDSDGFMELGGIAQLFFEHGQLRFSIRHESAKRARLQVSSKLLALSKRK